MLLIEKNIENFYTELLSKKIILDFHELTDYHDKFIEILVREQVEQIIDPKSIDLYIIELNNIINKDINFWNSGTWIIINNDLNITQ